MNNKIKMAILGFGQRGIVFANEAKKFPDEIELVAICDTDINKRNLAIKEYGVKDSLVFDDFDKMLSGEKHADFLVIATQDKDHFVQSIKALNKDYNLLLEKPIALSIDEVIKIKDVANERNLKVSIAHVLRYTPFYKSLKETIESGTIGEVVTMSQTENVGYFHYVHSYVRGNWHNTKTSSPMILAKACHDLDIIRYLMGSRIKSITSFGDLHYFKKKNKPEGAANRCMDCKVKCPFNAYEFYKDNPMWMKLFTLNEDVEEVLSDKNNAYGQCVYEMDNDAVDHQVVNMLFEDNRTASFVMTAFSDETYRNIKLHGTKGEIVGNLEENKYKVSLYKDKSYVVDINDITDDFSYHSGGDKMLLIEFVRALKNETDFITNINYSVESHVVAFKAEESRINNGRVIDLEDFFKEYGYGK